MEAITRFQPQLLSVLRIMSGLLLLQHGTVKILGFPTNKMNGVDIASLSGIAGVIELIFGALLVIGLYSRLSAFILSGMTAFAYFLVHAGRDFFPINNGGELAALYCFTFLFLSAAGPGPWSIDAKSGRTGWF